MRTYIDRPIREFRDIAPLLHLLDELTHNSGVDHRSCNNLHFIPFLMTCSHPLGAGTKRQPLHPARAYPGYLEQGIDKIESEDIRLLCSELADAIGDGIEMHETKKLMTFLNFVVRVLENRSKRPSKRRLT